MVEIIKQGVNPADRLYVAECLYCGTVFSFTAAEAQHVTDQRDGDYLKIRCPHCQVRKVSVSVDSFKKDVR